MSMSLENWNQFSIVLCWFSWEYVKHGFCHVTCVTFPLCIFYFYLVTLPISPTNDRSLNIKSHLSKTTRQLQKPKSNRVEWVWSSWYEMFVFFVIYNYGISIFLHGIYDPSIGIIDISAGLQFINESQMGLNSNAIVWYIVNQNETCQ